MLALLSWTWASIEPTLENVERVATVRLPRLQLTHQAEFADLEGSIALRNALLLHDASTTRAEVEHYRRLEAHASAALEALQLRTADPGAAALLASVMAQRDSLETIRAQAVAFSVATPEATPPDNLTQALQVGLDDYLAATRRLREHETGALHAAVDDAVVTSKRVRVLTLAAAVAATLALLLLGGLWLVEVRSQVDEKNEMIARLKQQRDALVAEVHHRIKNHLQGLLSLIDDHRSRQPHENALGLLQGHVLTLMSVHGLQSSAPGAAITLRDLVRQQIPIVEAGLPGARILVTDTMRAPTALAESDTVPLALAIGELLTNAVKHGTGHRAEVELFDEGSACCFVVGNEISPATPFDWERCRDSGGAGLQLTCALLAGIAHVESAPAPPGKVEIRMTLISSASP